MTHLMQQNIHTLLQIPRSPPIFQESLSQLPEKTDETKNQLDSTHGTPSKASQRLKNIEILSPQILRSYKLDQNLLTNTEISETNRAKMRLWIAANCHTRKLSFQTASLACYILDLYFSRGGKCTLEDFHYLGICCFRVANKMEDNYFIPIDYDVFKKDKLIEIEASICLTTSFELNPITFTEIAHSLYYFWFIFKAKVMEQGFQKLQSGLNFEDRVKIVESEYAFSLLHEFLQMTFLVLKTFKFPLDVVVSNAFFLILCLQLESHGNTLTASKIKEFIHKNQGPNTIWNDFQKFCQEMGSHIKIRYQEDCLHFLYPIYNSLITQGQTSKIGKDQEFVFDANQQKFRLSLGNLSQSNHFKDKFNSFKRYSKGQNSEKVRKCSEVTHV